MVTEASLIKEIEGHGLKILVTHEKYEQPTLNVHSGRMCSGVTHVQLFDRVIWEGTPIEERKNLLPIVIGEANCSENEQFSRKRGRIIALGRAKYAAMFYRFTPINDLRVYTGDINVAGKIKKLADSLDVRTGYITGTATEQPVSKEFKNYIMVFGGQAHVLLYDEHPVDGNGNRKTIETPDESYYITRASVKEDRTAQEEWDGAVATVEDGESHDDTT